jgi:hypothetical protein
MFTTKFIAHIGNCLKYSVRDTAYFTLLGGVAFSLYMADQGGELSRQWIPLAGNAKPEVLLFATYGWVASILAVNTLTVLVLDFVVRFLLSPTKWLAMAGWTLFRKLTRNTAVEVPHVG